MNKVDIQKKTIALYKDLGWKRYFAYIRFWDAPLQELEKKIPEHGVITELGCGDGIFSNYLALMSPKRTVIGIDKDKKRLEIANRNLVNARYVYGDIRNTPIPQSDCIVISHVLHHLSSHDEQVDVIESCKKRLKRKGLLIIMEIHVTPSPKYLLGKIFDNFLVPIFFESRLYSKIFYRKADEWKELLEGMNFSCKIKQVSAGKPISNIIIICNT